ncbi:MAG: hypothetical protein LBC77_07040 [Spirochaetaceae bacterium]|nr:hypothetical protein [Spirochaetaceae bacterium]
MRIAFCFVGITAVFVNSRFIGCIWFNTARLCRGSKFKNICKIGVKADTLKNFLSNDSPFSAATENIPKQERG